MYTFEEIAAQVGQKIRVEGFVAATRIQSQIAFVVLASGASKLQVVALGEVREQAKLLMHQSYAAVEGTVVAAKQAPGGFEIQAESVELVSPAIQWPISVDSEIGAKLDWPVARFRERKEALALIVQSEIEAEMTGFLRRRGFVGIHSPKLMAAPSESGSEVFEVKYFGEKAYLAQSPQAYKQIAIMAGLGKIYEVGPVFRAEPSFSSRHATEFISFDVELEGVKSEYEIIELECAMISEALQKVIATMGPELERHYPMASMPSQCVAFEFAEAQALLGVSGDKSLSAEEERRLGVMMQERGHDLVALTRVPWKQRPFYHMREGETLTRSFELLYRGVEITTGAVREHRHEILMQQLAEKELTGKGLEFYLDSFKLGAPPHGGFGLGLVRLTALFLGMPGIKEASFVHRGPGRLTP